MSDAFFPRPLGKSATLGCGASADLTPDGLLLVECANVFRIVGSQS